MSLFLVFSVEIESDIGFIDGAVRIGRKWKRHVRNWLLMKTDKVKNGPNTFHFALHHLLFSISFVIRTWAFYKLRRKKLMTGGTIKSHQFQEGKKYIFRPIVNHVVEKYCKMVIPHEQY